MKTTYYNASVDSDAGLDWTKLLAAAKICDECELTDDQDNGEAALPSNVANAAETLHAAIDFGYQNPFQSRIPEVGDDRFGYALVHVVEMLKFLAEEAEIGG